MYKTADYHYLLPPQRIAQHPLAKRDTSRLLCLHRQPEHIEHHTFSEIINLLNKNDVLVLNNTKVIPGRLFAQKETGGKVEVLLLGYPDFKKNAPPVAESLIKASKRPPVGSLLRFENYTTATVVGHEDQRTLLQFQSLSQIDALLAAHGHMPLPPYIRKGEEIQEDKESYQTVYATHKGAVAAPTAGLHFTPELLMQIEEKGIEIICITLHVGYGTFIPVRTDDLRHHTMQPERFSLSLPAARRLNQAREEGKRIIAVGTTCVRTLEYLLLETDEFHSQEGTCDIFIYPGFSFRAIGGMITNFHLPESTLLMLVSAFAGREQILRTYDIAIQEKYRFYSYGDAMLIL